MTQTPQAGSRALPGAQEGPRGDSETMETIRITAADRRRINKSLRRNGCGWHVTRRGEQPTGTALDARLGLVPISYSEPARQVAR